MGRMSFSLPANENFILKFVFPDASKLFDAELVTQQEGPVLAAERPCPLLKATSSFLCGRHQSLRCSAAAGSLVCPLQPSPPLWSAPVAGAYSPCPLLSSEPFFCLFCCLCPFHQQGCSFSIDGELGEESMWRRTRMLFQHPSCALLSQFSKLFSLCHLSYPPAKVPPKYFQLYINLVYFMT